MSLEKDFPEDNGNKAEQEIPSHRELVFQVSGNLRWLLDYSHDPKFTNLPDLVRHKILNFFRLIYKIDDYDWFEASSGITEEVQRLYRKVRVDEKTGQNIAVCDKNEVWERYLALKAQFAYYPIDIETAVSDVVKVKLYEHLLRRAGVEIKHPLALATELRWIILALEDQIDGIFLSFPVLTDLVEDKDGRQWHVLPTSLMNSLKQVSAVRMALLDLEPHFNVLLEQ